MFAEIVLTLIILLAVYVIRRAVIASLMGAAPVTVIPHILGLRYSENTGAAFSILSDRTILLTVVTFTALAFMAYLIFIKRYGSRAERMFLVMIFSGGVGNLIERLLNGYVVDYFEFLFMRFAIFNLADSLICVGVFLLLVYTFLEERKKDGHA